VWEVVNKVIQVAVIPLLLLIWQELRDTRATQVEQLAAVVRLQVQMETALQLNARVSDIESWRANHEGQLQVLMNEFRDLQKEKPR